MSKSLKDFIETKVKRKSKIAKISIQESATTQPESDNNAQGGKRWTKREVLMLYKGLSLFGTDFSAITTILPRKTRNQIIHKYHREEKINKKEIVKALKKHEKCETVLIKHFSDILPTNDNIPLKGSRFNSIASADSVDVSIKQNLRNTLKLNK